ncbi:MAG: hypothetical protein HYW52_01845 [Gemmatimonadetes bacterium]|nr:hypothetical protein [Gemmatimonadota bacterium]MBI2614424.1 hypothetical protein [Gemmatimonadota bacterium]
MTAALTLAQGARAQDQPFVVDYYYKARWGYANEFIQLFKKNHYPVLKKQVEMGRLLQVSAAAPRYHGTEDGRWDYRVTIVFRNAAAHAQEVDLEPILRELYPDRAKFEREEQRRFEILVAHWDVPVVSVDLTR